MSRGGLRFLSTALELAVDRRRHAVQFTGLAAGLLMIELASRVTAAARGSAQVGYLLGFPFLYVILMATATVICASCRHDLARRDTDDRETFEPLDALLRHLLPAAAGSATLFLTAGAVALACGLLLVPGQFNHALLATVSALLVPVAVCLAAAVALLALGLLVFPPIAALSGGDLDGLMTQFWRTLRTRLFRVLGQEVAALALAALFTALVGAALWAGWAMLEAFARNAFPDKLPGLLSHGVPGFVHRVEWLLVAAAAGTPAMVFLNAASYLILSAPEPDTASASLEEEETWLLP